MIMNLVPYLLFLFAALAGIVQAAESNEINILREFSQKLNSSGESIYIGYNASRKNPNQVNQYLAKLTQIEITLGEIKRNATAQFEATQWSNAWFRSNLQVVLAIQETYTQLIGSIRTRNFHNITDYNSFDFLLKFNQIVYSYPDYWMHNYVQNSFRSWNTEIPKFMEKPSKDKQAELHEVLNRFSRDLGQISNKINTLFEAHYEKARKMNQYFGIETERNLRLRILADARWSDLTGSLRDSIDKVHIKNKNAATAFSATIPLLISTLVLALFLH